MPTAADDAAPELTDADGVMLLPGSVPKAAPLVDPAPNENETADPELELEPNVNVGAAPKVNAGADEVTACEEVCASFRGSATFELSELAFVAAEPPESACASRRSSSSISLFPEDSSPTSSFFSGHWNLVGTPAFRAKAFFCSSLSFAFRCSSVPILLGAAASAACVPALAKLNVAPVDADPDAFELANEKVDDAALAAPAPDHADTADT